jgi:Zinc finger, C3HC4 type (RING finger)
VPQDTAEASTTTPAHLRERIFRRGARFGRLVNFAPWRASAPDDLVVVPAEATRYQPHARPLRCFLALLAFVTMSSDNTDRDSLFSSSGSSEDSEERNHDPHNNNNNVLSSCPPTTTSTEEDAEDGKDDDNEDGSINHDCNNNIEAAASVAAEEESKESKEVQQSTDKEEEPSEQVATVEGNVQDDTGQETSPPQNQPSTNSTSIVQQPNDTFTPPTTNGVGRRMVEFDVEAIREQVTCRLCRGLYREPYTTLKCFHTFCKSCLATALHSSKFSNSESFNACPQCQLYLGRHADPASVALPDRTLESLLDKVLFPQLARDDDLAEQLFYRQLRIERKELPGELLLQRQQQQQQQQQADSPRTAPESQRKRPRFNAQEAWEQSHAVRVTTTTVLFQLVCTSQETTTTTHTLKLPFLKTEGSVRVEQLKRYIIQKLNLEANSSSSSRKHVVMQCHSVVLPDTMTVAQIEDSIWEKYSSNQNTIMQLSYTLGSTSTDKE